ncbi:MAG: acyltransferase family protein [Gammaproteobacteria bacterium]|jgi:glucans biosynthesis protein C|nr:acyltransferase family protein [Gammaproteobacteria bacterium]
MTTTRRYELDWLRVLAFGVLIYFHAAIFFVPGGLPLIQNTETSPVLKVFIEISTQFRLALLFFISGVGVFFARRRRSEKAFIWERSQRLLIPFFVGLVFVVPPMVYTEKVFLGEFAGSLLAFYPLVFTTGLYPEGNLSWHHFWFVVYLYLFCLLGLGAFRKLGELSGEESDRLFGRFSGPGIFLVIPLLTVPEWLLRAAFPGFRNLIHDWASFTLWFLVFLAGYIIAGRQQLLEDIRQLRYLSTLGLLTATISLYLLFGGPWPDFSRYEFIVPAYLIWCALRVSMIWCAILTCLGFAGQYLRVGNPVLSYLNEAVYPLFILHLTTLVVLGYFIVPLSWSLWLKYLILTSATFALILVFYQVAIRPFNVMRLLFGVKPL